MRPGRILAFAAREVRASGGRLGLLAACLAIGVAAVVAVAATTASLDRSIRSQAREILGADVAIEGWRPLPPEAGPALTAIDPVEVTSVRELGTTVSAHGRSALVQLEAIDGRWPLYGELELEPEVALADLGTSAVAIGPEVVRTLGVAVGDELRVGDERLTIAAVVRSEPRRLERPFAIGGRVLLSTAALDRSGLEQLGSRIRYSTLVRLDDDSAGAAEAAAEALRGRLDRFADLKIESYTEAQPEVRRGIEHVGQFLGLVALVSLVLGAVGVAQAIAAWIAGRRDEIAILKALGVRPLEVGVLFLVQAAGLALLASLAGAVAGLALQPFLPSVAGDLLPTEAFSPWQPAAAARGIALGLATALAFAALPLSGVRRVPAARALRHEVDPLPPRRSTVALALAVAIAVLVVAATIESASLVRGLLFAGGLAATAALLAAGALAAARISGVLARRSSFLVRHGLAALRRPGAGTLGAIVALGLGLTVVLAITLVQRHLAAELDAELPRTAPTTFLVDIQPEQWPEVRTVLEDEGARELESVPVYTARLAAVDGRPVSELVAGRTEEDRWALTREQRLTTLDELPPDNTLVAGRWWSRPEPEVSVEAEYARELGVEPGSTLTLDLQGVPISLVVSSVREVDWRTFRINFFLVVEPSALAGAPHSRLASAQLERGAQDAARDRIGALFPNVLLLDVRHILATVTSVLGRLGAGIRLVGSFAAAAGLAILAGAVLASRARRAADVALLKTIGLTRADVVVAFAVEQAVIGAVAGTGAAIAGAVLAWAVVTRGLELEWSPAIGLIAATPIVAIVLAVVAGIAAGAGALRARPAETLRSL